MNPFINTPVSERRTPIAYGYARVSHKNSLDKGDSLPSQCERICAYYESTLKKDGVQWGDVHDDGTNVSAYRVPFHARPAGRLLIQKLKPGDHLILDKVDRIWRSMEDFVYLMKRMKEQNINVHIVNFLGATIRNNTPMGEYSLRQFVLIAELESMIKSERIKEALDQKRKKAQRFNHHLPAGCKVVMETIDGEQHQRIMWCERTRNMMDFIVRLIDDRQLPWKIAVKKVCDRYKEIELRDIRYCLSTGVEETFPACFRRLYQYEVAYRYLGITDPSQIPSKKIITQAARQHRRQRTNKRIKECPRRYSIKKSTIPEIKPEQLLSLA